MVKFLSVVPAIVLATVAAAQTAPGTGSPKITSPNGSKWWVAKSTNLIEWDCKDTSHNDFTVLVGNKDTKIWAAPIAVIAQQPNYQCSITITQDKANQPAGTGWTILFANPVNNTDVWSTSEEFEIKELGAAYPTSDAGSSAIGSSTGTSAASGSSPTGSKSAAVGLKSGLGAFGLAALGFVGLAL